MARRGPARARRQGRADLVAGAAFAIAWTPCIGPTLGAILSAAALTGSAARGAFLLAVYSAGLAIPFLLTAVAFSQMTTAFTVVKRHYQLIVAIGGLILIAMGVLIWTDELTRLNAELQSSALRSRARLLELLSRLRILCSYWGEKVGCAGAPTSWPIASTSSRPSPSRSREQTMRKRPVPSSGSGSNGRPRI